MAAQDRLCVWMHGQLVATLVRQGDRLSLAYSDAALQAYPGNTPLLSVSLPLRAKAHGHEQVRPFFDALLPEGEARRMLAHDFRLAEGDTFGLLRQLGRDCAGALVVLPEGEGLPCHEAMPPTLLTPQDLAKRLRHLGLAPLGIDQRVRISLAGVQQKLVLTRLATGAWALPIDGWPSSHLLKRADPRFDHMVANEAFCMALARAMGLPTADAELLEGDDSVLVVTRYDRVRAPDGTLKRLHQEDLTQAFSLPAHAKHEEHGGPSLRQVAQLLREQTVASESLPALLGLTLLNVVLGNADAHAKNLSLLHPKAGQLRLAPAYDLLSTAFYPQVDVRPGMLVNGKPSIHEITAEDVAVEARTWGLPQARVHGLVGAFLARLPAAFAEAAQRVSHAPPELLALVQARAAKVSQSWPDSGG